MSFSQFRGCTEWALMVALVLGAGAVAQAQQSDEPSEDRVIQIGPANDAASSRSGSGDSEPAEPAAPQYWIGLLGGPVTDALRHHVELPEGQGLLVGEIVPGSPAANAGLERYDIMVRANDTELTDMHDLVDLVSMAGPQESPIAIEVLRHGTRETVSVTPAERPENVATRDGELGGERGQGFGGQLPQDPRELFRFFGQGQPLEFRDFRREGMAGGDADFAGMPSGVAISIHKEGDQPARVTVERGDETWEVVADDPQSLEQLPEDLRPFVERMLDGGGALGMGGMRGTFPLLGDTEELNRRMEEMEQRMEELRQRLLGEEGQNIDESR